MYKEGKIFGAFNGQPILEIMKELIVIKVSMRWPFSMDIIRKAMELCDFRVNKCEEHLLYAIENKISPLDAIEQDLKMTLDEPLIFDLDEIKHKAELLSKQGSIF